MSDLNPGQAQPQALVDVLDPRLDTGVVLDGQVVIALAGVDLIHVGPRALLAPVDSAIRLFAADEVEGLGCALMGGAAAATGPCGGLSLRPSALNLDPGPLGRLL